MTDECRSTPPADPDANRAALIGQAFRLEWFTIAWMIVETVWAIGAGVVAHSLLLIAFGIDSIIELVSAEILIWRLSVEFTYFCPECM